MNWLHFDVLYVAVRGYFKPDRKLTGGHEMCPPLSTLQISEE